MARDNEQLDNRKDEQQDQQWAKWEANEAEFEQRYAASEAEFNAQFEARFHNYGLLTAAESIELKASGKSL
jgi:hypothetical protein